MADPISTKLEALAACLCEQISPKTCFCGVVIGDEVYDFSGIGDCGDDLCGQAWVRVTDGFMAETLGEQDTAGSNCGLELNVPIEIGVLRCFPVPERGEAVEASVMLEAFEQQNADMLAMRRAVACCEAIDPLDFILGSYTPQGPSGGLFGGTWTAIIGGF